MKSLIAFRTYNEKVLFEYENDLVFGDSTKLTCDHNIQYDYYIKNGAIYIVEKSQITYVVVDQKAREFIKHSQVSLFVNSTIRRKRKLL